MVIDNSIVNVEVIVHKLIKQLKRQNRQLMRRNKKLVKSLAWSLDGTHPYDFVSDDDRNECFRAMKLINKNLEDCV